MEINFNQVSEFLTNNADSEEVKGLVAGYVNKDSVSTFLETEDGKGLLQPRLDSHFTKGLKTWKEKSMQSEIDKAINAYVEEHYPNESEEAKQIRELKQQLENQTAERQRDALKALSLTELSSAGIPALFAEYLVGADEETTKTNIAEFATAYKASLEEAVKARLKENGGDPKADKEGEKDKPMTRAEFLKQPMSYRTKVFTDNPQLYKDIMSGKTA